MSSESVSVCILTVSDTCSQGQAEDLSGPLLASLVTEAPGLEVAQRDVVEARDAAHQYHGSWQAALAEINQLQELNDSLTREKVKLLETNQSTAAPAAPEENTKERGEERGEAPAGPALLTRTVAAGEAVMANIGTLKLYEILFGLLFITIVISWNPFI